MSSRSLVLQSTPLPVRMPRPSLPHTARRAYAAGRAFSRILRIVRFVVLFPIFVVRLAAHVLSMLRRLAVIACVALIAATGLKALVSAPSAEVHGPTTTSGSNAGRGLIRASAIEQPQANGTAVASARYFDGRDLGISQAGLLLPHPQTPTVTPSLSHPSMAPLPLQHTTALQLPPPSQSAHVPARAPRLRLRL
jgi:hypothetical protein